MISLRRDAERLRTQRRGQDVRSSFDPQDRTNPSADGFGVLEAFNEIRLSPAAGNAPLARREGCVLTYVLEGSLALEDSTGRLDLIQAGEFQRMTTGRRIRHNERNGSRSDWAHVVQVWLHPPTPVFQHPIEQKRFPSALRRGKLCLVASEDGRNGSLALQLDVQIYSAILDPGQHLVHELAQGRSSWVQILRGEASINTVLLSSGDGMGVTAEWSVSLTARDEKETEILLLDLPQAPQSMFSEVPSLSSEVPSVVNVIPALCMACSE